MACVLAWHAEVFGADTIQDLIEGIYDARPELARKILRSRILTDREPTMAEKELIRVAAKRWSFSEGPLPPATIRFGRAPLSPAPELPAPFSTGAPVSTPAHARSLLEALLARVYRTDRRYASDRPVAAILLDREGRVLGAELNTNARIRTRHAEMNLLLRRGDQQPLPRGTTLVVSLKPCAMCAARIWEAAEDPAHLTVVYLEDDPGKLARNTVLTLDSPARLRFLGLHHPHFAEPVQMDFGTWKSGRE